MWAGTRRLSPPSEIPRRGRRPRIPWFYRRRSNRFRVEPRKSSCPICDVRHLLPRCLLVSLSVLYCLSYRLPDHIRHSHAHFTIRPELSHTPLLSMYYVYASLTLLPVFLSVIHFTLVRLQCFIGPLELGRSYIPHLYIGVSPLVIAPWNPRLFAWAVNLLI